MFWIAILYSLYIQHCYSLYTLHNNDLPLHTKFSVNFFANDSVLTIQDKNIHQLQKKVNE